MFFLTYQSAESHNPHVSARCQQLIEEKEQVSKSCMQKNKMHIRHAVKFFYFYRCILILIFVQQVKMAHLETHEVYERLVADGDVAQQLSDLNSRDGTEERHKESEDWTQSGRKKKREREPKINIQLATVLVLLFNIT